MPSRMNCPSRIALFVVSLLAFLLPRIAHAEDTCPEDWKKNVYLSARDSVVSIETVGFEIDHFDPVAGVVYPDRRHVVAITHAAGIGRGVRVRFAGGAEIDAEPVLFDEARHVTILKLASEAPAGPVHIADRPLEPGKELMAIAPFEGVSAVDPGETALDARIHVGHVANVGDRALLRFDATWSEIIGAPLYDCEGNVVAMRGWGAMLPARDILAAAPNAAPDAPVDVARWSALHMHLGMLAQGGDGAARIGASTGLAVVQGDRWQVRLGLGVLGTIPKDSDTNGREKTSEVRLQAETTVGYRILLTKGFPTYLVPQIGVVGRLDLTTTTTTTYAINDTSCIARGGPCDVEPTGSRSTTVAPSMAPVVGAAFMIPGASLGYQMQLDVADPARSTHQVYLGFEF